MEMNKMKRFAIFSPSVVAGTDGIFKVTGYEQTFNTGCLP